MKIRIKLFNPDRSYSPGEIMDGQVEIINARSAKAKDIRMVLEGSAMFSSRNFQQRSHSNKESFLSCESAIGIHLAGENYLNLPVGTVAFPFRIIVPHNSPSSFDSPYGQVSYLLRAVVRRYGSMSKEHTSELPITVSGILDLNLEDASNQSQKFRKVKEFKVFGHSQGKIDFSLRVPNKSGFVPGEDLGFIAEIKNDSNRKIYNTTTSLRQVVKLKAQHRLETFDKTVVEIQGPEVKHWENKVWEDSLNIPPIPPTRLGANYQMIDVQYVLHFEMTASGVRDRSLTGQVPVVIGTIPLWSSSEVVSSDQFILQAPPEIPMEPILISNDDLYVIPSANLLPDYSELPPPSYAEALDAEALDVEALDAESLPGYSERYCEDQNIIDEQLQRTSTGEAQSDEENIVDQEASDGSLPRYITHVLRI